MPKGFQNRYNKCPNCKWRSKVKRSPLCRYCKDLFLRKERLLDRLAVVIDRLEINIEYIKKIIPLIDKDRVYSGRPPKIKLGRVPENKLCQCGICHKCKKRDYMRRYRKWKKTLQASQGPIEKF